MWSGRLDEKGGETTGVDPVVSEPDWTVVAGDITSAATTVTKVEGSLNDARQRYCRIASVD